MTETFESLKAKNVILAYKGTVCTHSKNRGAILINVELVRLLKELGFVSTYVSDRGEEKISQPISIEITDQNTLTIKKVDF